MENESFYLARPIDNEWCTRTAINAFTERLADGNGSLFLVFSCTLGRGRRHC